ncbi:MAG: PAS domain-containing protein [Cyanobacteriota bacterium]
MGSFTELPWQAWQKGLLTGLAPHTRNKNSLTPGRLAHGLWSRLQRLLKLILRPETVLWLLLAALLLLPLVMIRAISNATLAQMKMHAEEVSTLATDIRSYYADNVIARLQAADGKAVYSENYRDVHGGIPIPATLSIELGALFDNAHSDGRISYEFISDYPFAKRVLRSLDDFEVNAIRAFRDDPSRTTFTELSGNGLGRSSYRLATPVIMRQACVTCHNAHPDSPKRDWKVGDIRGIQEVTVRGLLVNSFGNLNGLFGYVSLLGVLSVVSAGVFQRQSRNLRTINRKLESVHERESDLAARMSDQLQELSLFGTAVDNSIVGIAIADMRKPDAPLVYVNDAFTRITGYTKQLAIGFNCRFLQGPDTDPAEVLRIRQALEQGQFYSGELINYRHDGSRFWNRLTLSPVGGSGGKPDFFVANQVDITHLKVERGVPVRELTNLENDVDSAQEALANARRFAEALQQNLQNSGQCAVEHEAFLLSEQKAHQDLAERLSRISGLIQRYISNS